MLEQDPTTTEAANQISATANLNTALLSTDKPKKVLIETWGCQMNVADSEQMLSQLKAQNYITTEKPDDADLVVLNTCHIREKAKHKVMSRLGRLRELQKKQPFKIAVTGCVAQAEGKTLFEEAPNIDLILGPGKIDQLSTLIEANKISDKKQIAIGFRDEDRKQAAPALDKSEKANPTISGKTEVSRFINISQGCDNFCTFCVVPFTRGREISLLPSEVVQKAKAIVAGGAKELTLLGQNVNSYGLDLITSDKLAQTAKGPFVDLLEAVAQIEGLRRLRFTTSNPHDFTKPLADLFQRFPQLGRYMHLPVQSGSDDILERMKRKVTAAEYLEKLSWLRSIDPEFAVSTDLIVGFPGESDEDFDKTMDLVKASNFSFIYAFKYSPRKGTAAIRFKDQVAEETKTLRLKALMDLQDQITTDQNRNEIGHTREVLCHYKSQKEPNIYYGRTQHFRLVRIESMRDLVGQEVVVTITDANKTALVGQL